MFLATSGLNTYIHGEYRRLPSFLRTLSAEDLPAELGLLSEPATAAPVRLVIDQVTPPGLAPGEAATPITALQVASI